MRATAVFVEAATMQEYGYTLQRSEGRVEVWLYRDDTLKHVAKSWLGAFQFATLTA